MEKVNFSRTVVQKIHSSPNLLCGNMGGKGAANKRCHQSVKGGLPKANFTNKVKVVSNWVGVKNLR